MRSLGNIIRYPQRKYLDDGSQVKYSRLHNGWLSNILEVSGHEMDDMFFDGFGGVGRFWQKFYSERQGWGSIHPPAEDSFQPHEWLLNTNGRIYTQQGNVLWVYRPETDEDHAINERTKFLGKTAVYVDGKAARSSSTHAPPPRV